MKNVLFLFDTIHGFPANWKECVDSFVQFQTFLKESDICFKPYALIEDKMQLVELSEPHHSRAFLNRKYNGPYYELSEKLAFYFETSSIQKNDISELFYFSELGWCDYRVPLMLPNASVNLICMQNGKANISKRWTQEDMEAYGVEHWRYLDLLEWQDVLQSELLKDKLLQKIPEAGVSLSKPHL